MVSERRPPFKGGGPNLRRARLASPGSAVSPTRQVRDVVLIELGQRRRREITTLGIEGVLAVRARLARGERTGADLEHRDEEDPHRVLDQWNVGDRPPREGLRSNRPRPTEALARKRVH